MHIKDYLNQLLNIIATNPHVESQSISIEERPPHAAYINGTVTFINGAKLHFKESILFKNAHITFLKYAYNYASSDNTLISRYDNALDPKVRDLPTYPEHKHLPDKLLAAQRPSFEEVLREISNSIEVGR
jgi:hypothetical protein